MDQQNAHMAMMMMQLQADILQRLRRSCMDKCLTNYTTEMHDGENVCLDRCVFKFSKVHEVIDQKMREQQEKAQQAAAASSSGSGGGRFGIPGL